MTFIAVNNYDEKTLVLLVLAPLLWSVDFRFRMGLRQASDLRHDCVQEGRYFF